MWPIGIFTNVVDRNIFCERSQFSLLLIQNLSIIGYPTVVALYPLWKLRIQLLPVCDRPSRFKALVERIFLKLCDGVVQQNVRFPSRVDGDRMLIVTKNNIFDRSPWFVIIQNLRCIHLVFYRHDRLFFVKLRHLRNWWDLFV